VARTSPVAAARSRAPDRAYVTARGAIVLMLGGFVACSLLAGWLHLEVLIGLGYAAVCGLTPFLVRSRALVQVVVAPPAFFLAAVVATQALTAQGTGHGRTLSVLEGTMLTLAAIAPWLLGGTALCVGAAMFRGLPGSLRKLQAELRGEPGTEAGGAAG
jgi:hypothetical protein